MVKGGKAGVGKKGKRSGGVKSKILSKISKELAARDSPDRYVKTPGGGLHDKGSFMKGDTPPGHFEKDN